MPPPTPTGEDARRVKHRMMDMSGCCSGTHCRSTCTRANSKSNSTVSNRFSALPVTDNEQDKPVVEMHMLESMGPDLNVVDSPLSSIGSRRSNHLDLPSPAFLFLVSRFSMRWLVQVAPRYL